MIQIINGTYGHLEGGKIIPKTEADGPFEAGAEQEKRLVALGVAKVVTAAELAASPAPVQEADLLAYDETMKLEDLKAVAKLYGLTDEQLKPLRAKKDVVALIDQTKEGGEKSGEEETLQPAGDAPPQVDAQPPVQ